MSVYEKDLPGGLWGPGRPRAAAMEAVFEVWVGGVRAQGKGVSIPNRSSQRKFRGTIPDLVLELPDIGCEGEGTRQRETESEQQKGRRRKKTR